MPPMNRASFLPLLSILLAACGGAEPAPARPVARPDPPVRDVMDVLHRNPIRRDEEFRETRLVRDAGRTVLLVQVNKALPPQISPERDQVVLILEGAGTLVAGTKTLETKAGDLHEVPRGTAWSFANLGPGAAALLVRDVAEPPAADGPSPAKP